MSAVPRHPRREHSHVPGSRSARRTPCGRNCKHDAAAIAAIGAAVRRLAPRAVITCARGSSDHAATYRQVLDRNARRRADRIRRAFRQLGLRRLRKICAAACSSRCRSRGAVPTCSPRSRPRKRPGATILALCNSPDAPLIAAADLVIELRAGVETSVAATKSYLATLAALVRLVAAWTQNAALDQPSRRLPDADGSELGARLVGGAAAARVGRASVCGGPRSGARRRAGEAALKCKETCGLHAEAFSSAELRHGPYALVGPGFPALLFAQRDATRAGVETLASRARPPRRAGADRRRRRCRPGVVGLPTIPGRRDRTDTAGAKRLPVDRDARGAARLRPGSSAAFAQGHGDGVRRTALVNGRMLTGERDRERPGCCCPGRASKRWSTSGSALRRSRHRGS